VRRAGAYLSIHSSSLQTQLVTLQDRSRTPKAAMRNKAKTYCTAASYPTEDACSALCGAIADRDQHTRSVDVTFQLFAHICCLAVPGTVKNPT
jgi:hypothetical protein